MSRPRYDWWGYCKGMIRRYPALKAEYAALHTPSPVPQGDHIGGKSNSVSDPTAMVALRELPTTRQREYEAVRLAIKVTGGMPRGQDRLHLVDLVFWRRTHTLDGAAMVCQVGSRTAQQWHGDFIRMVARNYGLLDLEQEK